MNGKRPPHVKPPAYLTPSPPVPEPAECTPPPKEAGPKTLDPVRYGDWEIKGIAIDF
ncbi:DUF1674 domain-containing protein [Sphingomonas sp. KC8]|uniref:DUF1674 domain-containing protein n=1 Tax=Sphingomonas sp. KC8 TaxID=1030157 RepID=UPI000A31BB8D|nr:DUF1674 domain-containing protein [Sphingomonas sp. KC8]ARS29158.1 hypothetical protein KC8_17955 [Sphingomonas sp. KC8]